MSTTTLGSNLGTGGMETKLIAAEIATAAGVTTVITSSKDPKNILKIIQYNNALRSGASTPLDVLSGRSSPAPSPTTPTPPVLEHHLPAPIADASALPSLGSGVNTPSSLLDRPPHTLFKPSPLPLRDLKAWTSHTLHPSGSVVIDAGAHQVLSKRESGGRLLPAGVLGVRGAFASGQAVKILVRRDKVERAQEKSEGVATEPNTPMLQPIGSMTSSISTLDGDLGLSVASLSVDDEDVTPSANLKILPEEDVLGSKDPTEDWEIEEVGRGLANYNYAQISRVKGLKRCATRVLFATNFVFANSLCTSVRILRRFWDTPTPSMSWKTSPSAFLPDRSCSSS